jgi:hypothetical protein
VKDYLKQLATGQQRCVADGSMGLRLYQVNGKNGAQAVWK